METPVLSRKERDRRLREDDFLNAAEQLFSERGYAETSMEDVAKKAEYATGTIYRYFDSKEKLYHHLLLRKGRLYFAQVDEALRDATDPMARLRALVRCKVAFFFANRNFMRIYIQDVSRQGEQQKCQMPEELQGLFDQYMKGVRQMLVEGMDQGVFRKMNVDLLLPAYNGFINELLSPSMQHTFEYSETEIEQFIFSFLEGGLISEPGKKQ